MSFTVTSFWKSTKALARLSFTCQSGAIAAGSSFARGNAIEAIGYPHSTAAIAPAAIPPVRHWPSVSAPFAAPATCMPGGIVPGVNAAISSVHTGLPPRWQVRCTAGFQPPDTASASHSIFVGRPFSITSIASTPRRPCTCDTRAPVIVLMPSALNSPGGGSARESMTAATSMPAACASAAVRQPSSLLAKTAMRRPGVAA